MRRRRANAQMEMFRPDGPVISITEERHEEVIGLVSALILEVMTSPDTVPSGGDHDPDHG